jgi:two-component system, chemotaxis family, CheB/CheR fusion protein
MRSNISRSPFNSTGPSAPLRPNGGKPSEVFFIVGVGASAGGLEAFTQLLRALPIDTGMAFVFVQHLDPHHESALPTLLSKATPMSVVEVGDRTPVEPNTVYVLPPNKEINLVDGVLTLSPRPTEGPRMTIDLFFASLAESRAEKSVGVLLSGTGSDGISGLQAIHSHGGLTLVQDPPSAKYDGMPRGAIEAGCADFVLSPADIARELARIARHRHENEPSGKRKAEDGDPLQKIFSVLRKEKGIDFSHYKLGTIERRIQRRMFLLKIETLRDYADFLKDNRDEARSLCSDLLIRVTRFFRDEAAFRVLTDRIFPEILRHKPPDEPFRIWVPGCSNGEEVYSLAMCLVEFLGDKVGRFPIQIFGTDVSESALENARAGLYPESIESDVSPERLRRFFTKKGGRWQIVKSLRDTCVFARQDILKDPPFSRVDLVSCRNVLIYLAPAMQKRALAVFHFALNPAGYILFGTSEAPGPAADLFGVVDPKWKIYSKKPVPPRQIFDFALSPRLSEK